MSHAICTLFEGHYHLGVGALINSLHASGFSGLVICGHRGPEPAWAPAARALTDGIEVRFVRVAPEVHFTFYKPQFMQVCWAAHCPEASQLYYFDPDIVVKARWPVLARWAADGVALCEDVNGYLPARHPYRLAWGDFLRAHGLGVSREALRRQLAYALPFGVAFALIVPQQQFHHYAVAAAVTPAVFAIYSVGTFQLPVVDILYTPVSELLQIGLAQQEGAGLPPRAGLALFHEAVLQLSFAFFPLAGLLAVSAPTLIELLFSARYLDAAPVFRLAVLSVVLAALPLDGVMRARAQNRFMIALSGAKLAATAAFVLGGLAAAGPFGALAGWLLAEALARGAMLHRAARLFAVPLREVLPARALVVQAAATGAALPPAALVLHAVPGPLLLRLSACGLAYAAAYLLLSSALGGLPAGWLDLVRARRPRPATAPPEP